MDYINSEMKIDAFVGYINDAKINLSPAFSTLLARVRAGADIFIENDARPAAVLHSAEPLRRTISECITLLPEDSAAIIDPDFSKDVEAAIESHRAPLPMISF